MNIKVIKALGLLAAFGGAALSLLGGWANEKQQKAWIADEVAAAMANTSGKES